MSMVEDRGLFARPRVVVIGGGAVADALARRVELRPVGAEGRSALTVAREAGATAARHGAEALLVSSGRFALAGWLARRRTRLPAAITLTAGDVRRGGLRLRLARRLDHAFVDDVGLEFLVRRGSGIATTLAPPVAPLRVEVPARRLAAMARLVRGATPGRLVLGMPWPQDQKHVRWYRDAVAPYLAGDPLCLLLGAPGRRPVGLLTGRVGMQHRFRAHVGMLDAGAIAAAARVCDLFVLPAEPLRMTTDEALLAMMSTAVPVVAGGGVRSGILVHEGNAFVVPPADAQAAIATINQALALPAVQRHYLGEDFAEYNLRRWTPELAAETYAERLAAIVGRPRIPAELRAA